MIEPDLPEFIPLSAGWPPNHNHMNIFTRRFFVTRQALTIFLASLAILLIILFWSIAKSGPRDIDPFTTIHGIPFPITPDGILVTENLAHADIKLKEPVLGKKLKLTITLDPLAADNILLGIRSKSFWFSYSWINVYSAANQADFSSPISLTIPLTDKFQEPDRTIDLMFYAPTKNNSKPDQDMDDQTRWLLKDITAEVAPARPTIDQFIDYLASLVLRERAV